MEHSHLMKLIIDFDDERYLSSEARMMCRPTMLLTRLKCLLTVACCLTRTAASSPSSSSHFRLNNCKWCSTTPRGGHTRSSSRSRRLLAQPNKARQRRVDTSASKKNRPTREDSKNFVSLSASNRRQRRRACGFYLWDAPSALFYYWCHHLQRDCIYEGRGGHKFVRIEPGSVLQLLYPCHRYSPDRCLFCGGSFHDHLLLWWSPNLYTPFDLHLDRTRATAQNPPSLAHLNQMKRQTHQPYKPAASVTPTADAAPHYSFHRHYVLDADDVTTFIRNRKKTGSTIADIQRSMVDHFHFTLRPTMALRQVVVEEGPETDHRVMYLVPVHPSQGSQWSKALLECTRSVVLFWMDQYISMQEAENIKLRRKGQHQQFSDDKDTSRW